MFKGAVRAGRGLLVATAMSVSIPSLAHADVAAGEMQFKRSCAVCHSAVPGEILTGPSLARLMGRKAGSAPGYPYSPAIKATGYVWNAATLDAFIAAPRKAVPKTNMAFTGLPDPAKRADLIAYLATLK